MFLRFCLYGILKNLRFFEPFFVLYLLAPPSHGGAGLSYFQIGSLVGYQKLLTGLLEIPLGRVRHPPLTERLLLRDDGTRLDRAPGDGIFTARVVDHGRRDFEFAPALKLLIERAGAYEQFVETAVFYRLPPLNRLQEKGLYYSPIVGFSNPPFQKFLMEHDKSLLNAAGARRVAAVLAKKTATLLTMKKKQTSMDPSH